MKAAFSHLPFSQKSVNLNKTELQPIELGASTMRERSDSQTKRWKMTPLLRLDSQGEVTGAKQFCDRPQESRIHQINNLIDSHFSSRSSDIVTTVPYNNNSWSAKNLQNSSNGHIPNNKSFSKSFLEASQTSFQSHSSAAQPLGAMNKNTCFTCPVAESLYSFSSNPRILGSVNIFGPKSSLPCNRCKDSLKKTFPKNMDVCNNVQQHTTMDVNVLKVAVKQPCEISQTNSSSLNTIVQQKGFSVPSPNKKMKDPDLQIEFKPVNNVNNNVTPPQHEPDNLNNNVKTNRKKKRKQRQRSRKRGHKTQSQAFQPAVCSSPVKDSHPLKNMKSATSVTSVLVACATTITPSMCKNISECQTSSANDATTFIFSSPSDTEHNNLLTSDSEHDSISLCNRWRDGTSDDDDLIFNDSDSHDGFLIFQGSGSSPSINSKSPTSKQKSKQKKELKRHLEETSDDSDDDEKSVPTSGLHLMIGVSISEDEDYDYNSSVDWDDFSTSPGSAVNDQFIFEFEFSTGLSLDSLVGQTPPAECQVPLSQELKDINTKWNDCYKCCPNTSSRKAKNCRKVQFADDEELKTVHIVGDEERAGEWQRFAVERAQFKQRIDRMENIVAPIFSETHRARIINRFLDSN